MERRTDDGTKREIQAHRMTGLRSWIVRPVRAVVRWTARRLQRWSDTHDLVPEAVQDAAETIEDAVSGGAPQGRTVAQVVTTALSVLLIAMLIGAILYEGYAGPGDEPAQIEVDVLQDQAEHRGERFYVPIAVRNTGDETVEEIVIGIEVMRGEELVEETELVVSELGEEAEADTMLILDEDPAGLSIDAGAVTFQIAEQ